MRNKKLFSAPAPIKVANTPPLLDGTAQPIIHVGENPSNLRTSNLNGWLGQAFRRNGGSTAASMSRPNSGDTNSGDGEVELF